MSMVYKLLCVEDAVGMYIFVGRPRRMFDTDFYITVEIKFSGKYKFCDAYTCLTPKYSKLPPQTQNILCMLAWLKPPHNMHSLKTNYFIIDTFFTL